MDGQRFDDIAKAVAQGTSRRSLLRGALAALIAMLAGGTQVDESQAARKCRGAGGICGSDRDCCQHQSTRCVSGKCCPKSRHCAKAGTCCAPGEKCCGADGCAHLQTDPNNCGRCGKVCPSGVCRGGKCREPRKQPLGTPCSKGNECSSGRCADGVCCDSKCTGQCEHCNSAGHCVPTTGTPIGDRDACDGDGSTCGGTCDGSDRRRCAYPDETTPCRDATCEGVTATLASTCDGQGTCTPSETVDCSPYQCGGDGTCLTTCDGPEDCLDGFCTGGGCCPGEDYCGYGDVCCDPERSPTASCCPADDGGCCECFNRTDPGREGPICCRSEKLCGTYPNDKCCHDDEGCFEGSCVWEERLCGGGYCPDKCCGDTCCGPWDTCGTDETGNSICVPLQICSTDNPDVCPTGTTCSTYDQNPVCCPPERLINLTEAGAPEGSYECCPFGEQPNQGGSPFTCSPGPNFGGTSRGTSFRI